MDIKKSGYMTKVEETDMPQVNRLLVQHRRRYHATSDEIPCIPKLFPILTRWDRECRRIKELGVALLSVAQQALGTEKREHEWRPFEEPKGVLPSAVSPSLNRTKVRVRE
jgi:hypothetical protein